MTKLFLLCRSSSNKRSSFYSYERQEEGVMRKKLVGVIAAGAASVLMLSGFDSAMTVQELTEKTKEAFSQVKTLNVSINAVADANLSIVQDVENGASMDVPINGTSDISMALSLEPFQAELYAKYSGEAMGQGMNGLMDMYVIENDDGTGSAYTGMLSSEGEVAWSEESIDAQSMTQVKEMVRSALAGDMSGLSNMSPDGNTVDVAAMTDIMQKYQDQVAGISQIAPQSVNVDGKECYQMTCELTGDILTQMMSDAVSASGQAMDDTSLQIVSAALGGIKANIETLVDVQTYLPVKASVDLSGSDFSMLEQYMVSSMAGMDSGMKASVNVSTLSVECTFGCNDPVQITVPQEALDASAAGGIEDINPSDLIGGILGGGSGSTDTGSSTGTDIALPDTDDGPVQNSDGTYRISYEDYSGNVRQADIAVPDGLRLSYGSDDYLSFTNDDYTISVSYSLFSNSTLEETVENDLDVTYMQGNSDYSNVTRTDVMKTALDDGTPVCYGFKGYVYNGYGLGGTEAAVQAGDSIVSMEIQIEDDQRNVVEAGEDDVKRYAGMVKPAA